MEATTTDAMVPDETAPSAVERVVGVAFEE